ncbi:MAG TPA: hypothetical protein PLS24_02545 [Sedimentisphaerales bacterium]|mgnify:FL=1|nr:hypothetical protein [Phycisphaerae bacterium]HON90797.1 hypothetical protein [Sedimentisphaerales bacterium]HOV76881.1 hypothetical protein [Sedimentisphaerales bacterium]HQG48196.1 hypothetical protein [Sedimentisphaerales bacterium]
MNSDEMRIELEQFVNNGLREGWTGWPLKAKGGACVQSRWGGQWSVLPDRAWRRGLDERICPAGMEDTFAALHSLC